MSNTREGGKAEWELAHAALVELARERAELDFQEGSWLLVARRTSAHRELGYGSFTEYVERCHGYEGFFTRDNVAALTEAAGADERYDQAWYEGQGVSSIVLTEQAGRTTLHLTVRYDSKAVRDHVLSFPATAGVEMGYDRLAEWLAGAEGQAELARLD